MSPDRGTLCLTPPQPARRRWIPPLRCLLQAVALALAGPALAAQPAAPASAEDFADKFMQMGTGSAGGAFRPIGEALCDTVNKDRKDSLVRCVAVSTAGSSFNINAVANGAMQLGVSQEDLAAKLYGDARQARGSKLRVVSLLHASPIAVVVRKEAGIQTLDQIAGKVMNLGNRGSGQFSVTAAILRALALRTEDLAAVRYLATSEFEQAFCAKQVDVVVEAVAHPSPLFEKLLACDGQFIDIPAPVVERMVAENPFLSAMQIPAQTYAAQAKPVQTLGMRNLLVTSAGVSEEAVFRLTTSLLQRHAELVRAQPLLGSMPAQTLDMHRSLPVPLHPGAERALLNTAVRAAP